MIFSEYVIDEAEENKEIIRRYRKLRRLSRPYLKKGDSELILKAFKTAVEAHKNTRRKSGEPYIYHPIQVAIIAVDELNLGPTSVAAALLHDVVEDTEWELEDIKREFGSKVAKIVDGVTKIPSTEEMEFSQDTSQQAENFRKMLLALSDDARVIFIKLADRLHNMRTLSSMPRHKQLKIASESMYIYAPLAHRLGLYNIKSELEDLYLKYTQESVYREIARKLDRSRSQRNKFIKEFITPLEKSLADNGFKAEIFGRPKSIYSIWTKMRKQNISFEEIYDLFAIRIIIDTALEKEKADCWRVYSIVTDFYSPNIDRLRDWISTPRANGYESLHTTVMGPDGRWVEVQIRTQRMNEVAEKGYAAHWKYKELGRVMNGKSKESNLDSWLRLIRDLREQNSELPALEFVDDFRANFFSEEVFAFTPKGQLKTLPQGATALDFAFEIHSELGFHCLGAKINQKLVPLNHQLKNGDQVEIITSKKQKPNADWLKYVQTAKAKARIKEFIKTEMRQVMNKGKEILTRKLTQLKLELNNDLMNQLKIYFDLRQSADVLFNIGKGIIQPTQITKFKSWRNEKKIPAKPASTRDNKADDIELPIRLKDKPKTDSLVIGDESDMVYSFARCCNPISGDDVFGFTTIGEGIKIHRTDCKNAPEMMANYGYRIIKARWKSQQEQEFFLVELRIVGTDRIGLVRDVTKVISGDLKVNIAAIDIGIKKENIFEGNINLYVKDASHLDLLKKKLYKIEGIISVERLDNA